MHMDGSVERWILGRKTMCAVCRHKVFSQCSTVHCWVMRPGKPALARARPERRRGLTDTIADTPSPGRRPPHFRLRTVVLVPLTVYLYERVLWLLLDRGATDRT